MKFYYNRTFIPRYSSIPKMRFTIKADTDTKDISVKSNDEDITEVMFQKTGEHLNIMEMSHEKVIEMSLDFFVKYMNCGLTGIHYDCTEKPKPVKMRDGKVVPFLDIDKITEEEMEELKEQASEIMKEAQEKEMGSQKYEETKEGKEKAEEKAGKAEGKAEKAEQRAEKAEAKADAIDKDWKEFMGQITSGLKGSEKDYKEEVEEIIKDKPKLDPRANGLVEFINGLSNEAFKELTKKEKVQAKAFKDIISSSPEAMKAINKTRFKQL